MKFVYNIECITFKFYIISFLSEGFANTSELVNVLCESRRKKGDVCGRGSKRNVRYMCVGMVGERKIPNHDLALNISETDNMATAKSLPSPISLYIYIYTQIIDSERRGRTIIS